MKMVEKVELVEKKVAKYIAFDGTEFSSRSDCIAYEERKNRENLSQIEQCEEAKGNPNFDGCEHMEYNDYFWFRPKSAEEIELLMKAYVFPEEHDPQGSLESVCEEVSGQRSKVLLVSAVL